MKIHFEGCFNYRCTVMSSVVNQTKGHHEKSHTSRFTFVPQFIYLPHVVGLGWQGEEMSDRGIDRTGGGGGGGVHIIEEPDLKCSDLIWRNPKRRRV